MYDRSKVETIKYLDLSKRKWRSVEVRNKKYIAHHPPHPIRELVHRV